jgi:hypothetical protein
MSSGYFASPWPGEDGGPARLQIARSGPALNLRPGERLQCVTRNTVLSTMTVLGDPGEVYLLTHSALRANLGFATTSCVERIDPQRCWRLWARRRRRRGKEQPKCGGGECGWHCRRILCRRRRRLWWRCIKLR